MGAIANYTSMAQDNQYPNHYLLDQMLSCKILALEVTLYNQLMQRIYLRSSFASGELHSAMNLTISIDSS